MSAKLQQCGATELKQTSESKAETSCRPIDGTSVRSSSRKVPNKAERGKQQQCNQAKVQTLYWPRCLCKSTKT